LSLVEHLTNAEVHSSDPRSSKYGNHYTSEEVTNLFAPSSATVDVVKSWLVDSGIREERISQSSNKAWLQFDASVDEMEQLLQAKYYYYEHVNGGRKHIGCEDYKIPAALSDHIDYVTPGVKFVPTTAMGDIKKRDLASRSSQLSKRQSMSADVLRKIKRNPGMLY
jgi:tripeptidyl-peptidase-1